MAVSGPGSTRSWVDECTGRAAPLSTFFGGTSASGGKMSTLVFKFCRMNTLKDPKQAVICPASWWTEGFPIWVKVGKWRSNVPGESRARNCQRLMTVSCPTGLRSGNREGSPTPPLLSVGTVQKNALVPPAMLMPFS